VTGQAIALAVPDAIGVLVDLYSDALSGPWGDEADIRFLATVSRRTCTPTSRVSRATVCSRGSTDLPARSDAPRASPTPSGRSASTSVLGCTRAMSSSTVKDLFAGSRLVFEDAGEHELKGVTDRSHLYRVVA